MDEPFVTKETLPTKAKEWYARLEPLRFRRRAPDRDHSALLVVDMQRYFLEPGAGGFTPGAPPILDNIKRLIERFRDLERPVIYSRHVHRNLEIDGGMMVEWWGDHILDGTAESEIHPDIAPKSGDKVIAKHRYSAFYGTDLESFLKDHEITDLVLTGVMTNLCCESTARDAFYRDFRVFFLLDATGAMSEAFHISTLINLAYGFAYIVDTEELLNHM